MAVRLGRAILVVPAAALTVIVADEFYLSQRRPSYPEIDDEAKRLAANEIKVEE